MNDAMDEAGPASPPASPPALRPVLLGQPEPAEVTLLDPEGPVLWLRWRGEQHRIVGCIGPETISGRWWLGRPLGTAPQQRDYYRLQNDTGRWLWAYRMGQRGRWFVHGTWG